LCDVSSDILIGKTAFTPVFCAWVLDGPSVRLWVARRAESTRPAEVMTLECRDCLDCSKMTTGRISRKQSGIIVTLLAVGISIMLFWSIRRSFNSIWERHFFLEPLWINHNIDPYSILKSSWSKRSRSLLRVKGLVNKWWRNSL
jgi:hypothetical protein